MTPGPRPIRIAVVAPIMVRYDAISMSARDTVRAFAGDPGFSVLHFGIACDYPDVPHRRCDGLAGLLRDPDYRAADIAIFHFGIYHELFLALLAGGAQVRIVRFHNVTPARFVAPREQGTIEKSLIQIEILRRANEIWADSLTNMRDLLNRGFDSDRLRVIPLVVEDPPLSRLEDKAPDAVHVLYVGRFAPAKGLHDLVEAVARLPRGLVKVTLAGNTTWSAATYLDHVRSLIAQHGLSECVNFVGTVDDAERERLFREAHILAMPSYHEGFCRPVAEGFRAGCVPVVYDAYNLPLIANHLGRVVPTGDVDALAAAIGEVAAAIPAALASPSVAMLPLDRGATSAAQFTDLAHGHVAAFAYDVVKSEMRSRVCQLDALATGTAPIVEKSGAN